MAFLIFVPRRGLEPPRLATYAPQAYVFTNYTTWAGENTILQLLLLSPQQSVQPLPWLPQLQSPRRLPLLQE